MGDARVLGKGNESIKLPIAELFLSVAGEGLDIGRPSFFIRVKGCPKPWCKYCDTKYARKIQSEDEVKRLGMSVLEIFECVKKFDVGHVTITGGNPLYYKQGVRSLVRLLKSDKPWFEITLQEKGQCYDKETWETVDCVDFDVKTPFTGIESNLKLLKFLRPGKDYVKFLIASLTDYEYFKRVYPLCGSLTCVLQPGIRPFDTKEDMLQKLKLITDYILRDGYDVRVLPQLHKQLYGMRKRGV